MIGIYTITNIVNNKMYVGYSVNIKDRWRVHRIGLINGNHANNHLQNAWKEYGEESFLFELLVRCKRRHLASEEHYWATILNAHNRDYGYNIKPTHPHEVAGISRETAEKISKALTGKKLSKSHIQKLSDSHKGKPLSQENRIKNAERFRKLTSTKEFKDKISKAHKGKPRTTEERKSIGDGRRGIMHTEEAKVKMSESSKGLKIHTEEHKKYLASVIQVRMTSDIILKCLYCSFETFNKGSFNKWHNKKCKYK